MQEYAYSLILFGITAVVSAVMVRMGIVIASRYDFVARPNPIVQNHKRPVALGGGISLGIVLVGMIGLLCFQGRIPWRIPLAIFPVILLGALDDILRFKPGKKFLAECLVILPYMATADFSWWTLPLVGFFLLSCMNAWNLLDIMDGLLGWTGVICFLGIYFTFFIAQGKVDAPGLTALIGSGAIAGFLVWNSHPAKVYMGDAGSLALGTLFGVLTAESTFSEPKLGLSLLLPGLIPLFEMVFLIIVRTQKGIPFYRGSPDHFALRLLHNGRTVRWIVLRVGFFAIGLSIFACFVAWEGMSWPLLGIAWGGITAVLVLVYRALRNLPVWNQQP